MRTPIATLVALATLGAAPAAMASEWHLAAATPMAGTPLPSEESIAKRAALQHHQLQLHQGMALATLGTMAVTAGLGVWSANYASADQRQAFMGTHMALGGLTSGLYLSSAALALTAPPGYDNEDEGLDSVTIHRWLAWGHGATMAATLLTGIMTYTGSFQTLNHGILGGTTLGLMALSAGVIALDF